MPLVIGTTPLLLSKYLQWPGRRQAEAFFFRQAQDDLCLMVLADTVSA